MVRSSVHLAAEPAVSHHTTSAVPTTAVSGHCQPRVSDSDMPLSAVSTRPRLVVSGGSALAGALFHKNLGLGDEDKARLEQRLQDGGAAVVVMADEEEVEPTQAELASLGGEVENYKVPEETMNQMEEATDVQPVEEADGGTS